jgi:hypothetical protein
MGATNTRGIGIGTAAPTTAGQITISGTSDINIGSTASARNVNVGTGGAAQTVTVGSGNTTSTTTVDCGTGGLNLGTTANAHTTTLGSTSGVSAATIQAGTGAMTFTAGGIFDVNAAGAVTIDSTGGTIGIGAGADAFAINIGTGAAARTITIGNGTGATSLVLDCGTGALNIGTNAVAHTITMGNGTGGTSLVLDCGTGALNIGTNAVAHTVSIGNQTGASALTLDAGTGAVNIATGAQARTINLGTGAAAQTISIGSTNTTSSLVLQGGQAAVRLRATAATGATVWSVGVNVGGLTIWASPAAGEVGYFSGSLTATKMINSALASSRFGGVYDGVSGELVTHGVVRMKFVSGLTSLTAGDPVYISGTAGLVTKTAPTGAGTFIAHVGILLDGTGYDNVAGSAHPVLIQVHTPIAN